MLLFLSPVLLFIGLFSSSTTCWINVIVLAMSNAEQEKQDNGGTNTIKVDTSHKALLKVLENKASDAT